MMLTLKSLATVVVLLVVAAGCARASSGPSNPALVEGRGQRPGPAVAAPTVGLPDPEQVQLTARRLDRALTEALADCLRTGGYPQWYDARSGPVAGPVVRRPVLGIHPAELGPTSVAQARTYGMTGMRLVFVEPSRPIVESSVPAYNTALDRCLEDVSGAADIAERLAGWQGLADRLRQDLLREVEPAVRTLLTRRLRCVQGSGYPDLPVRTFLDGDSGAALADLGIPKGVFSDVSPEPPPLPPNTTRVLPASPPQTYTPSQAEVRFALAYVRCGRQIGLEPALDAVVTRVARPIVEAHAAEFGTHQAYFEHQLAVLSGPR